MNTISTKIKGTVKGKLVDNKFGLINKHYSQRLEYFPNFIIERPLMFGDVDVVLNFKHERLKLLIESVLLSMRKQLFERGVLQKIRYSFGMKSGLNSVEALDEVSELIVRSMKSIIIKHARSRLISDDYTINNIDSFTMPLFFHEILCYCSMFKTTHVLESGKSQLNMIGSLNICNDSKERDKLGSDAEFIKAIFFMETFTDLFIDKNKSITVTDFNSFRKDGKTFLSAICMDKDINSEDETVHTFMLGRECGSESLLFSWLTGLHANFTRLENYNDMLSFELIKIDKDDFNIGLRSYCIRTFGDGKFAPAVRLQSSRTEEVKESNEQ